MEITKNRKTRMTGVIAAIVIFATLCLIVFANNKSELVRISKIANETLAPFSKN